MAFQSTILAWRVPCTEKPGGLQSMWSQRVNWVTNVHTHMDLTFQVPMQYCSLQHRALLPSLVTSTTGYCLLWFHLFIHSGVISPVILSSILGTNQPGESIFQYPIFLPFHRLHGVLKARILKFFAIPFSCGPGFVRTLHHDPPVLGGPTQHGS